MASYEDDIEPISEPARGAGSSNGSGGATTSLGKRQRGGADTDADEADAQQLRNSRLSPEPDEDLDTTEAKHQVWLVKVPKFLIQAWSSIQKDDLRLGTVRVYDPDHTGHQRMELLLPAPPAPAIPSDGAANKTAQWNNIPRAYDLKLTSDAASTVKRNLYAFREKFEEEQGGGAGPSSSSLNDEGMGADEAAAARRRRGKGRRTTALCGTITNEASLQPQIRSDSKPNVGSSGSRGLGASFMSGPGISDEYRELLRKRREEASKPKRTIKMLDTSDAGRANMLVAGVGAGHVGARSRFNQMIARPSSSKSGAASSGGGGGGSGEKFARLPRNELLDVLFGLFEKWQYWSLKKLRSETQQPESYLKEVLGSIADLHKRGPYVGNYSLKPEFSDMRKKEEEAEEAERRRKKEEEEKAGRTKQQQQTGVKKGEDGGDDDEDDDEEDDDDEDDDDEFDDVV